MRQLVLEGPRQLRLRNVPERQPRPGEVRVSVAAAGVCGSDLYGYRGDNDRRAAGVVMGHEVSGRVDCIGDGVDRRLLGQAVVINPLFSCGRCSSCVDGRENLCPTKSILGCSPRLPGGFADSVVVPSTAVISWTESLPLHWGAFCEPLAVGLHALERADVPGARVLVVGSGAIGVAAALSAGRLAAASVALYELDASRLDVLERLALTATTSPPDSCSFDVVIDCVASEASLDVAVDAVVRGGLIVVVGVGRRVVPLRVTRLVDGERRLAGSAQYTAAAFRRAVDWLAGGSIDCDLLLGTPVSLELALEVFPHWAASGVSEGVRAMVSGAIGR